MRTTLSIDDDVLAAAKALALQQHKTVGEVISLLTRQALQPSQEFIQNRNGIPLLANRNSLKPVTPELVNQLRDELPLREEREQLRQIQLDQLRQQIQAGIDSGPSIPAEDVFNRLSLKYQAMTQT